VSVTWKQALAWRLERHLLDPVSDLSVPKVAERLCGVQAQVASSAELAVRIRRSKSAKGEVARALTRGSIIKTWAMRGTLHLLDPKTGPAFLSLIASGRSWERPSWQKYFGVSPDQIEQLRGAAREALGDRPLTREELIAAVTKDRRLGHIGEALSSGWGTLLKPLAWNGDLCFGPSQGNRVTFTLPELASPKWPGIPPVDDAAPVAILAYLSAHGPSTPDAFGRWLAGGWFGVRQLKSWFADLGDKIAEVDLEGQTAFVRAQDLDDLRAARPTKAVRLLGGFDQYVLAPGTGDHNVVPAERRPLVSKQSGWISPVVVVGGRVAGIWSLEESEVLVSWFGEEGPVRRKALGEEVDRLGEILDRNLRFEVVTAKR
jgi:hypothetical protein